MRYLPADIGIQQMSIFRTDKSVTPKGVCSVQPLELHHSIHCRIQDNITSGLAAIMFISGADR
jgi:hypothetical protein